MGPLQLRKSQNGSALLIGVLALFFLSAVAAALMYLTTTETGISANFRSSQQALLAAYAGMQEVRERLATGNTAPHLIPPPTTLPGGTRSVLYVLNPAGASDVVDPIDPTNKYFDDQICKERFEGLGLSDPGAGQPCPAASTVPNVYENTSSDAPFTNTAAALSYKWVRITLKANDTSAPYYVDGGADSTTYDRQVCYDGVSEILLPAGFTSCAVPGPGMPTFFSPVYVLTAYAKGSRRMAQMEVAPDPPLIPNAAFVSQDNVDLSGQLEIQGYDHCSCTCTTSGGGATKTMSCTDRAGKTCDRSKYAAFATGTVEDPVPPQHFYSGTSPAIAENQGWPYPMDTLIDRFKNMAGAVDVTGPPYNYSCPGSNCGTRSAQQFGVPPQFAPEPPDNPASDPSLGPWTSQITYIPGSVELTGQSLGSGVLVVDGDLDLGGGFKFYGLVLVKGAITFTGGGPANPANIYGAVLSGNSGSMDAIMGGSVGLVFDSCALPRGGLNKPAKIISKRDLY